MRVHVRSFLQVVWIFIRIQFAFEATRTFMKQRTFEFGHHKTRIRSKDAIGAF